MDFHGGHNGAIQMAKLCYRAPLSPSSVSVQILDYMKYMCEVSLYPAPTIADAHTLSCVYARAHMTFSDLLLASVFPIVFLRLVVDWIGC